ncbi:MULTISPECIES: 1-carboxybiuret hydrolase subunit AtzG [Pseudomonadota]|uniref:1-carboxybiuret hydrolase subunit AtzG n=1 Tax=Pseudomonas sp. (strain ADP) TaxID=47660 RepID=ATZG_PSESD|nr:MULTISPECIES: 1-carboxybiuret hydrolase subunit AtzG [Pseudomonadota]A0A384E126.1 RecName: Full=1-carboxybiuret hydrolase subunit AtzG [Pseudomonas sp. ADP]6C62_C Chain C, AtzG [Pseudomonas sp. ADP]6C62_D Chain D, AtzG [Pseudomonas sp. ADP]6C6G_C Chain C, AtzG [Pseudomonas sp. ADP]6C6G_D Chain D, AtzG [Pseudomonas sp. ADP]QOF88446.1 DUF4089 domain-containing protein [Pseudomonas sp. ADPe]WLE00920.1 1-carboxybiuret hydrolase subunit AtzG [Agrobacterium leguminum]
MTETEIFAYIEAASIAIGIPLEPARARAVAHHFSRTALLAEMLESVPLSPESELAEIYRPAPFPAEDI